MSRSLLAPLVLIGVLVGPASSQPLLEEPMAFNPYSETAMAITGPVILSTTKMVFETGKFINLQMLDAQAAGGWGASGDVPVAQLFRVLGNAGPLRRGNTLCGDQPVTYMRPGKRTTPDLSPWPLQCLPGWMRRRVSPPKVFARPISSRWMP